MQVREKRRNMDPRSQLAQSAVITLALALTLGLNAIRHPRSNAGLFWASGTALVGLGVGFNALHDSLPPILTLVLANGLVFGGDLLILFGLRRFKQQPLRPALPLALFALAIANNLLAGVFGFTTAPNVRLALNALTLAGFSALTAIELLRGMPASARLPARVNGGFYVFFTALVLVRIGFLALGPLLADPMMPGWLQSLTHFVSIVAQVVTALLYIAILHASRLAEAEARALHDPLTGLLNRNGLALQSAPWLAHRRREGEEAWVLVLDVDYFKQINDRFGHAEGDRILCEVANTLRQTLRGEDCLARFGGEEFIVLLAAAGRDAAAHAADRLRGAVSLIPLSDMKITISIGLADAGRYNHELTPAIAGADAALLRAKRSGRNRIEFADGAFDPRLDLPVI
jgi:diguanylate cyclase (GGDEF)-like protein